LVLAPVFALMQGTARPQAAEDLHTQSAAAVLARDFPSSGLSYLLLDGEGRVIAKRWDGAEREIPVGSLLKPFLAIAYGRTRGAYPRLRCTGKKTCWLWRGHGALEVREAIAYSCNSYFHQLIERAGPEFRPAMEGFGLHEGGGADFSFTASPLALARAYLELTRSGRDRVMAPVLEGLALSARKGTASAVAADLRGMPALAKTGTAPCTHAKKAPGDGFAVVMFPAEHPRAVLLVRLHGRPGFLAASMAGKMIAKVESSGAPAP
jgi:cell division protein FtsI/penicillin-binding protein 2